MVEKSQIYRSRVPNAAILVFISVSMWLIVNFVFVFANFDWINSSDTGLYWQKTVELTPFDSAIVAGYPLLWRALVEIFPEVQPAILGQLINVISYAICVIVIHELLRELRVDSPVTATLLIAFFPLVGVTGLIAPRANAILHLLVFSAILMYVRGSGIKFSILIGLAFLVHRSPLPLIGVLVLLAFWERKIHFWMVSIILGPLVLYWLIGISQGNGIFWYLQGYRTYERILYWPVGDGLFGTLYLGLKGNIPDLIQGIILNAYWALGVFFLIRRIWRKHLFLLAVIVQVVFLGLSQPASEIWALYNYTPYFALSVLIFAQQRGLSPLRNRYVRIFLIVGFAISQFAWAAYMLYYLS